MDTLTVTIIAIAFALFLFGVLCYAIGYSTAKRTYLNEADLAYKDGLADGEAALLKDPAAIKNAYDYFYGRRP